MKKITLIALSLALSLALMTGCSPDSTVVQAPSEEPTSSVAPPSSEEPASSEAPPSSEEASSVAPPSSEAPKKAESGQLKTVYDTVIKDIFGETPPAFMLSEDAVQIEEQFGLSADMMKDYIIAMPMMNVKVDTFIGIEAAEGKAEAVEEKLNAYKEKIIADRTAFPYLTDHLPKAKGAQVIKIDDYVFYLSLGNADVGDVAEADLQKMIDAEIQKAADSVRSVLKK